jgi:Bacteriophage coat protein B.
MQTQVQQTNKTSTLKRGLVVAATIGATLPAFAETTSGFDPSTIVTIISGFVAGVSAIGLAVLSLVVTGKVFKWVRTAM